MEFLSDDPRNSPGTSGSANDPFRPSIFELIAQDKLRNLLKPALRFVLAVYAQRYPRYLIPLVNRMDLAYAIVMAVVERHYLMEWGGSFAENFYGLKRVPVFAKSVSRKVAQETQRLTRTQVWGSIFFLVVVPYLKSELDDLYERMGGRSTLPNITVSQPDGSEDTSIQTPKERWQTKLRTWFKKSYPIFQAAYLSSQFIAQFAYMYGKSEFSSPWLYILGLRIRRLSAKDYKDYKERSSSNSLSTLASALISGSLNPLAFALNLVKLISTGSLEFLKTALPTSVFFFRFLEWWYASEYHKQAGLQPIPPPPPPTQPHPKGLPLPAGMELCPICLKERTNPTMLPTGYVFCYPCVFKYVEEHHKCPISWDETETTELRRIYDMG